MRKMKTPCEVMNKFYLPSIRAMIARDLSQNYNCTQMKIADWLGVTQAAISQYLSSKRAVTEQMLQNRPEVTEIIKDLTTKLMNGEKDNFNSTKEVCRICKTLKLCEEGYEAVKSFQTVKYKEV
ncbi:MAG: transcriptional regulator [Candidatus Freyarchaeum deiterrae]